MNNSEVEFPIAEVFLAPQGEGFNTGTLMIFVRLAGCTVGKRYPQHMYEKFNTTPGLVHKSLFPIYTNQCTTADSRTFACDTDYGVKLRLIYSELSIYIRRTGGQCKQICLTGGEPLMHAKSGVLYALVSQLKKDGFALNLETSGTIPIGDEEKDVLEHIDHIAVSPKKGYLSEYNHWANEIKLLVDENFYLTNFDAYDLPEEKIFLQPINNEHTVNEGNIKRCLEIQQKYPAFRISLQSHKLWGTR